jgi:hypothetical protein
MPKTNERSSTQGVKTKPGFDIVVDDGKTPGQSEKELGAKWGVGEGAGPRVAKKGPPSPKFPGGLGDPVEPSESELTQEGLDQPAEGDDRPKEKCLDQAPGAIDRQGNPKPPPQGGGKQPDEGLDQSQGGDSDRPDGGEEEGTAPDSERDGVETKGSPEEPEELEYASSENEKELDNEDGTEGDDDHTIGPTDPRYPWKKVFQKPKRSDEGSHGSKDVEDLLERPESQDGSRYFDKSFYKEGESKYDLPDESEFDESETIKRETPTLTRLIEKNRSKKRKKNRKGKEPVIR